MVSHLREIKPRQWVVVVLIVAIIFTYGGVKKDTEEVWSVITNDTTNRLSCLVEPGGAPVYYSSGGQVNIDTLINLKGGRYYRVTFDFQRSKKAKEDMMVFGKSYFMLRPQPIATIPPNELEGKKEIIFNAEQDMFGFSFKTSDSEQFEITHPRFTELQINTNDDISSIKPTLQVTSLEQAEINGLTYGSTLEHLGGSAYLFNYRLRGNLEGVSNLVTSGNYLVDQDVHGIVAQPSGENGLSLKLNTKYVINSLSIIIGSSCQQSALMQVEYSLDNQNWAKLVPDPNGRVFYSVLNSTDVRSSHIYIKASHRDLGYENQRMYTDLVINKLQVVGTVLE